MNFSHPHKNILFFLVFLLLLFLSFWLDKALTVGLFLISFLTIISFLIFSKINLRDNKIFLFFLIILLIRVAAVLFIHYAHFQPFSGGESDYTVYQQQANQISERVRQGNFSLQGIGVGHYYPVIIGYIYAFTLPEMLIGQLFNAWLAAISVIFVYLIVREIGGSKKWAFLIGLIVSVYPSYLFNGSLLLKDGLVVLLVLAGLLFLLKLIKNFSWGNFAVFFAILTCLIHFRFYIGYVLLLTFIFCWLTLVKLKLKQRLLYGVIMIFLLGFSPQICGNAYYGINSFKSFLNPQQISFYREIAYFPSAQPQSQPLPGTGSSIVIKLEFDKPLKFILNYLKSFIYVLLGPLPWQMKYPRHFFALIETIPWYILLFFVIKGGITSLKRFRIAIPLIVFSFGVFAVLALFLGNFGMVVRIRMPAFISLLCLIPFSFIGFQNKIRNFKNKNKKVKVCHIASVDMTIKFLLMPQLKFLINQEYDVFVVCSPGRWGKDIEEQGIKVKNIKIKRKISPFSDLISLIKLFFYFKKEKFDIVHTHTPKPGLLGQLTAKMAGVPIIINTLHGFYFHNYTPLLERKFYILIEKIAAFCSDLIFSQNKEDIETALKEKIATPEKIKYLGNGIDIQKFNPKRFSKKHIEQKKEELKINHNSRIIGIVGRLVEEKGYLELFEAFKKVIEKFPETLLLVVGPTEPEKKDAIEPEIVRKYGIENNTLFLGERTDVDEIYHLMDVFVLPSYREGMPRSILEASAMERPVIATNIRGCREAVDDGKTGILVPVKNPEKLAETIIYLLEKPEKAKEMGKNGRIKAVKEFDERLVFERIKKEYERLIKEKLK